MMKNNKGITLASLVIAIVVISVIATITMIATTDDSLVEEIREARVAKNKFNDASIKQIIDNIYLSERSKFNSGIITESDMWDNIKSGIRTNNTVRMEVEDASGGINVKINGVVKFKITMENDVQTIE